MTSQNTEEQNEFDAKNFLRELDYPKNEDIPIVRDSFERFSKNLQIVINLYLKISQGKKEGARDLAVNILLARCINDIIAGFHLAKHGYFIQCYSVTRSILESLDKVELFLRDENWADVWVRDPKKAKKELTPSKVRKILGRDSYDKLYGHFCEMGSHPTFMSGSAMGSMSSQGTSIPNIRIWIAGATFEPAFEYMFVFTFQMCFLLLESILSKTIASSLGKLPEEEVRKSIKKTLDNWIEISDLYYMPFMKQYNIDAAPFVAFQKSLRDQFLA